MSSIEERILFLWAYRWKSSLVSSDHYHDRPRRRTCSWFFMEGFVDTLPDEASPLTSSRVEPVLEQQKSIPHFNEAMISPMKPCITVLAQETQEDLSIQKTSQRLLPLLLLSVVSSPLQPSRVASKLQLALLALV